MFERTATLDNAPTPIPDPDPRDFDFAVLLRATSWPAILKAELERSYRNE